MTESVKANRKYSRKARAIQFKCRKVNRRTKHLY
jgi:hypothetical protein